MDRTNLGGRNFALKKVQVFFFQAGSMVYFVSTPTMASHLILVHDTSVVLQSMHTKNSQSKEVNAGCQQFFRQE